MAKIDELLEGFIKEVENAAVTAIIHLEDGTPIAGISNDENIDIQIPVAYYSEVARKCLEASEESGFGGLEDMLIYTGTHYVIMRLLGEGKYVHILVLGKKGNWGIAKIKMQKHSKELAEALP
jgi:predicted regulator of Ras-like GTPase activity (Roadblock/LC7/MglB family)